jgi:hypothetical protein
MGDEVSLKDTLYANGTLGSENYLVEIKTTNHTVMVDEPESIGGGGLPDKEREEMVEYIFTLDSNIAVHSIPRTEKKWGDITSFLF